jgi:hypothetical protein
MIDASIGPSSTDAIIGPIGSAPVPHVTPSPVVQCPAVKTYRWLLALWAVKPTEHQGIEGSLRQIIAPARIVSSHAAREVQPASSWTARCGSSTSLTLPPAAAAERPSAPRRAAGTAATTWLVLTSMPILPSAARAISPLPPRSRAACASSSAALRLT